MDPLVVACLWRIQNKLKSDPLCTKNPSVALGMNRTHGTWLMMLSLTYDGLLLNPVCVSSLVAFEFLCFMRTAVIYYSYKI